MSNKVESNVSNQLCKATFERYFLFHGNLVRYNWSRNYSASLEEVQLLVSKMICYQRKVELLAVQLLGLNN